MAEITPAGIPNRQAMLMAATASSMVFGSRAQTSSITGFWVRAERPRSRCAKRLKYDRYCS
ncbi:MAG: hypothetical protein E4H48_03750, partial [Syntrophobacterales bacterium]